ncbi:MAG TPA: DUF4129 domain-containing protein [Candidatus Limnocylindria bacterium]|nr:DUF4129 domain-containing protein [Candidatus Limnocylindria bacterium]
MRGSAAVAVLIAARCFVEAVAFTTIAAMAHALITGIAPLPIVPWTLALFGIGVVLATIQREVGSERRGTTILIVTLAAGVVWGLTLPARDPDGLAVLSRMVAFGLIAEAFLWRNLSIARGAVRWNDSRNALLFAGACVGLAALTSGPIEQGPLPVLALLVVALSGLALSLARTTEELALARGTRGGARASSATGVSFVVGVVAILAAAFVPTVQDALSAFGTAVEPAFTRLLYLILLPLGYMAAFIVELLAPLVSALWRRDPVQLPPRTPADDERLLREIEATRPFVFGAVELLIVLGAVLVAVFLFDRMLRERRLELPEGVTLERGAAEGFGIGDTLRRLRPRSGTSRRAPRDDGTPSGALRLLYWRFLALAERAGVGWRQPQETPAEHLARIGAEDARWSAGDPLVRAFEELRYGESVPDAPTLDSARAALRVLETARRAS